MLAPPATRLTILKPACRVPPDAVLFCGPKRVRRKGPDAALGMSYAQSIGTEHRYGIRTSRLRFDHPGGGPPVWPPDGPRVVQQNPEHGTCDEGCGMFGVRSTHFTNLVSRGVRCKVRRKPVKTQSKTSIQTVLISRSAYWNSSSEAAMSCGVTFGDPGGPVK